jgi:hypothetical protein
MHKSLNGDNFLGGTTTLHDTLAVFAMFKEVTYLDLQIRHRFRRYYQRIPTLFLKAKQIVLNGEIPEHLSLSILHGVWHAGHLRLSVDDGLNVRSPTTSDSGLWRKPEIQYALKQFQRTWPSLALLFRDPSSDGSYPSPTHDLITDTRFIRLCMDKQEHAATTSLPQSNDAHFNCILFMDLSDPLEEVPYG